MYKLKTLFMKKQIAKKQKNKPFDYDYAEGYQLNKSDDDTINNSYYFSAHGNGQSLYCRLGLRNCHSEVWFYYSNGGKRYVLKNNLFKSNSPLEVAKAESGWTVKYEGELSDENDQTISARFSGEFTSSESAIDFFSHMPPIRTAKAMAAEKWSKEFFAEVQKNNQVHYEQTGRLRGTLIIGDKTEVIDLPCVRDHSFGKRDWNYMNNHMWIMAVNESSQLNFSLVSYPAMTLLEVGNFKPSGGQMKFMTDVAYRREAIMGGFPDGLTLNMVLDDKSELNVVVKKVDEYKYYFQDGDYCLNEGIAEIIINGENYRGIFELGYNKDEKRIFNGKELRKIKV